ncbi:MAG: HlyD family efflux transporter periplasmic adaptor subunit [Rhodopirellula sp.]|nr:HlyD family efflux transporter periplasmic adaptor subunit [Rhodopirellula sp.]
MKKVIVVAVLVLGISTALVYRFVIARNGHDGDEIFVSGNIEATDADVSFKIAGRVEKRLVDEGQMIGENEVVAVLDDADLRAEVELRRAELAAAKAALAELEAGSRPEEIAATKAAMERTAASLAELEHGSRPQEIAAAEAAMEAAQAELAKDEADLARITRLRNQNVVSAEEYDRARAAYQVASQRAREAAEQFDLVTEGPRQENIDNARAALAETRARHDLAVAGPRQETIDQARARVEQAGAALKLAETRLSYATVVSPLTGMVLSKNIEPGEYVAPGTPVVTIGDLVHVWLRAYIMETDLGRVKLGQRVRVTADTWPGKVYEGRVSFVADEAEFTPKSVQTEKQRVRLVYRIKIDIDNPDMELKPGMPADAEILLDAHLPQTSSPQ